MSLTTGLTRWAIGAAAAALLLALAAWRISGGGIFSPGALAETQHGAPLQGVASHAELDRRCGACHAAPGSGATMSVRCLECHSDIQAELGDSSALHGALDEAGQCLLCHTEHRGRTAGITRIRGSGLAHDQFGFSLATHRQTAGGAPFRCGDCHGERGFGFEAGRCASCHRAYQPEFVARHERDWGGDCRACHEGTDRFSRGQFSHDSTRFTLTGAHRKTACAECHAGTRALAGFRSSPTDCISCHRKQDTHRGEFGSDCAACHGTDSWPDARFEHAFPINHGEQGRVACRTCHDQAPSYRSYTCYGCHEHTPERIRREHDEEGTGNLGNCVRCHRTGSKHEGEGREREGHEHDDD